MKKLILALSCVLMGAFGLKASGWPANYEGVMLQGFYWDSYKATSWSKLTSQSDELSKYFKLIWIPNSAKSEGGMGYHPVYWFTNHNTPFGTEAELRTMIKTFKEKGTGMIADVIINHRNGKSNWTDFPVETWNGKTYQIGPEGICSGDEVRNASGQAKPTGNADTGENWDGARDLDHTNANVQANCKDYIKCLLTDFGYAGVRYDFVKGYAAQYNKMYNQANNVKYSVGEYWDGSYDAVKGWIDGTGKESAAFDFPFKYAVNKCFNGGAHNYTELVWKANGTTDQPAGMIHFGYSQYAVTFLDNHDTYRDGSKMTGDVLQANAFMLSCPGTPCVFWPHYTQYKSQIQAMIDARNGAGIHNNSPVKVLEVNGNCYVAEVTGSKGKLWIKLGNSSKTAGSNYTKKASGNGYEIWTTTQGGPVIDPTKTVTIYFRNDKSWATPHIHYWGSTESNWPGVAMTKHKDNVWKYTCPAGTTDILFNAGDGDATKTKDFTAVNNHLYSPTEDLGVYSEGGGDDPQPQGDYYLLGHFDATNPAWVAGSQVKMMPENGKFTVEKEITDGGKGLGYYSIVTNNASDWDGDDTTPGINSTDRYGAAEKDAATTLDKPMSVQKFTAGVNASSAYSWNVAPGKYKFVFDPKAMTLTVTVPTGVELVDDDTDAAPVWFNLQGVRVENPANGIFIRVQGKKARKVRIY